MTEAQSSPTISWWRWAKRALKVIAVLATVVAAFAAAWNAWGPKIEPAPLTESSASGSPSPSLATSPSGIGSNPSLPALGDCVGPDGSSSPCRESTSFLVVSHATTCSEVSALDNLAVDVARQLDVKASVVGSVCALAPGEVALAAGATAMDIKELAEGGRSSRLAVCYSSAGAQVSCSQPHVIEAVSTWLDFNESESARAARCEQAARLYTDRTFEGREPLRLRTLLSPDNGSSYRCAIEAPKALTESLWKIGGGELPN